MSIATDKGFVLGKQYRVTGDSENREHGFKVGTIVTLGEDDDSDWPYFTDGVDGWYVGLDDLEPVAQVPQEIGVTTEAIKTPVRYNVTSGPFEVSVSLTWAPEVSYDQVEAVLKAAGVK